MLISTYLSFNGRCREAFQFYAQLLGGDIVMMMTNGESPAAAQTPPEQVDRIMHARLRVGTNVLMGGDAPPPYFSQPQGFSVSLVLNDAEEGRRIFDALAQGGIVKMPFQKTFWSDGFGMLIDQFGTPWMINCGVDAG